MLLLIDDPDDGDPDINDTWWYAACDAGCSSGANWSMLFVGGHADVDSQVFDTSNHYFALDPQGRPRVVFGPKYGFDPITFEVFGYMVYAACDTACTSAANWSYGTIDAVFHQPALAFTSTGHPRIAAFADADDGQGSDVLEYFACDSQCDDGANWASTRIGEPGVGNESVALRLDTHNRPRMALSFQSAHSSYLWCNSACTNSANWGAAPIDLAHTDGGDPDLQLDMHGRPRIAFRWQDDPLQGAGQVGLGYAWCDANCESPGPHFQRILAEDSSQLDTDWPLPWPSNCVWGNWLGGRRASLALDALGNPRIAADSDFVVGSCLGQPGTTTTTHTGVRFIAFTTGNSTNQHRVLLPLVRR